MKTSLYLKKGPSSIGAACGSGLMRPLLHLPPTPLIAGHEGTPPPRSARRRQRSTLAFVAKSQVFPLKTSFGEKATSSHVDALSSRYLCHEHAVRPVHLLHNLRVDGAAIFSQELQGFPQTSTLFKTQCKDIQLVATRREFVQRSHHLQTALWSHAGAVTIVDPPPFRAKEACERDRVYLFLVNEFLCNNGITVKDSPQNSQLICCGYSLGVNLL